MPASHDQQETPTAADIQVPMPVVVRFIRQLSHDLRNHLNAAELQSAFLKEIAADGEVKSEVQRLRVMLSELGTALQKLTAALAPPKLTQMPYGAPVFLEDLQQKVQNDFGADAGVFEWDVRVTGGMLNIDPQLLQQALLELLSNALRHERGEGSITITADAAGGRLLLRLREPKQAFTGSTEEWGREPFKHVKHGHYGIGLHRARGVIEAHGGELSASHDAAAGALVTTVALPIFD
ncbi:MAG TPA: ATP-binding protein [Chthoniobacterales bacterium]|nr:ATP-binding protein [Chthoniobacterales bacterium]